MPGGESECVIPSCVDLARGNDLCPMHQERAVSRGPFASYCPWEPITRAEYHQAIGDAGGYDALTVFSSMTDPDGEFSGGRIYIAWGLRDADVPLVDACREKPFSRDAPDHWQQWPETYRRFVGEEWDW